MNWLLIIAGLILLFLLTRHWFWLLTFGLGGLAACFAMIASIIHFQILAARGFFILMFILWGIASAMA